MSNEVINPYQTFYDDSGIPLANGTISFLVNTTTALGAIFSDEALTVTQANPYTLDANGRVAGDVKYSGLRTLLIKTDIGATVRTIDNVSSVNSNVNSLSQYYIFSTVALYKVSTIAFPVGKIIHLNDRNADFSVISGTGTANTHNIIASTEATVNQSIDLIIEDGICNVKHFGAVGDGVADDLLTLQFCIDFAANNPKIVSHVFLPPGTYKYSNTLDFDIGGVAFTGAFYDRRQSGTPESSVTLSFSGGSVPMMSCNKASCTWSGFFIENTGSATSWLDLTSGSINHIFEKLYCFNVATHTAFTDGVIKCDGSRLGYSQFRNIIMSSPAADFIIIDGGGATAMTPISFDDRCLFRSTNADFTIVKVKNSTLERINFTNCTFIRSLGGFMTIVDTTDTPTVTSIFGISLNNCELDTDSGQAIASDRFFKLTNVINIAIDNNHINAGGGGNEFSTLINCTVSSFQGNFAKSFEYVFDADNASKIRGVGYNDMDASNTQGVNKNPVCSVTTLTEATSISLDGADWGPAEDALFTVDIATAAAYTFSLDLSKPQNWEPGQIFNLTIKNTSGGSIAAPLFGSGTIRAQSGAFTPPTNGSQITVSFRFDGSKARQLGAEGPIVSSS